MAAFEKQLNILDYTLASLMRRKMKNFSVIFIFSIVIFLLASFQMISTSLTRLAHTMLAQTTAITMQRMVAGRQESIPLSYIDKLHGIYGISSVKPRIWGYYFDPTSGANFTVQGQEDFKPADVPLVNLPEASLPKEKDESPAIIGEGVSKVLGLQKKKLFSFYRPDLSLKTFGVAGIFKKQSNPGTYDLILTDLHAARDLFKIPPGYVTDLLVSVANPEEITTIAKKISEKMPDVRAVTRPQIAKTYDVVFSWRSGFASICLLTAVAAFIILAWDKASGLSPEERREIAILKILGWETRDILAVRFWEGILVAALAFAIGTSLAYVHVLFFHASFFKPLMLGWSVVRPPLDLAPTFHFSDGLLLLSFTVLPYLAATVIPAWRCAIIPPDAAVK